MPPAAFEPAIPASDRPQTRALKRLSTGVGLETTYRAGHSQKKFLKLHSPSQRLNWTECEGGPRRGAKTTEDPELLRGIEFRRLSTADRVIADLRDETTAHPCMKFCF